MPGWDLTSRQLCDLELLATGGFSPLGGFLGEEGWASVCSTMRLTDGTLWPIPVTLDVPQDLARGLRHGDRLALRDPEGVTLAVVHVEDVWPADHHAEAQAVYGTTSTHHPGVAQLLEPPIPGTSGPRSRCSSSPSTTTSPASGSPRPPSGTGSGSEGGSVSWPSRPETRCTGPTTSRPGGRPRPWAEGCSSTPWSA